MEEKFCVNCKKEGVFSDQYCPKCSGQSKAVQADVTKKRSIPISTIRWYLLIWVNLTLGIVTIMSQMTLSNYLHWNRMYMREHVWIYLLVLFQIASICLRMYTRKCYSLLIPAITGLVAFVGACLIFDDSDPVTRFNLLYVFIVTYCAIPLISFLLFFMKPKGQAKKKEDPAELNE